MVTSRPLAGGTAIGFLLNFGFYGMIFAASVYFQQHQNLSPVLAGLALLPAMAVTMVASALSGRLSNRFPHRDLMLVGLLTACIGLALWAVVGDAPSCAVLAVAMLACGFGTSFTLTGASSTVMDAARPSTPERRRRMSRAVTTRALRRAAGCSGATELSTTPVAVTSTSLTGSRRATSTDVGMMSSDG